MRQSIWYARNRTSPANSVDDGVERPWEDIKAELGEGAYINSPLRPKPHTPLRKRPRERKYTPGYQNSLVASLDDRLKSKKRKGNGGEVIPAPDADE